MKMAVASLKSVSTHSLSNSSNERKYMPCWSGILDAFALLCLCNCVSEEKDMQGPFIAEEKVVFGIHAHAMSQMTISKIRKVYNKVDSKTIAKQVMIIKMHYLI